MVGWERGIHNATSSGTKALLMGHLGEVSITVTDNCVPQTSNRRDVFCCIGKYIFWRGQASPNFLVLCFLMLCFLIVMLCLPCLPGDLVTGNDLYSPGKVIGKIKACVN